MIAVILAAGMSTRLRPLTDTVPKSLLDVGGVPLLGRTLSALDAAGVERSVIVTGYLRDKIVAYVDSIPHSIEVSFVHNPHYATTGNNYSLFLAGPRVAGSNMLLLDADILFDARILRLLIESPQANTLAMKSGMPLGEEEIKVELNVEGDVVAIGKHISPLIARGESIGIETFSASTSTILFDTLSRRSHRNEFYEASFQEMIDAGVRIGAVDVGSLPCIEIDTVHDLQSARALASTMRA